MIISVQLKQICKRTCGLWVIILLLQLTACGSDNGTIDPCNRVELQLNTQRHGWSICASRHCNRIVHSLTERGVVFSQEGQRIRVIVPSYILFEPQTTHFYPQEKQGLLSQLKGLLYCYDVHVVRVASCLNFKENSRYRRAFARKQAEHIVQYFTKKRLPAQLICALAQCPTGYSKAGDYIEISFDYDLLKPWQDRDALAKG